MSGAVFVGDGGAVVVVGRTRSVVGAGSAAAVVGDLATVVDVASVVVVLRGADVLAGGVVLLGPSLVTVRSGVDGVRGRFVGASSGAEPPPSSNTATVTSTDMVSPPASGPSTAPTARRIPGVAC